MSEIAGTIPKVEPQKEYLLLVICKKCGFSKKVKINDRNRHEAELNAQYTGYTDHMNKCPNGPVEPQDISVT